MLATMSLVALTMGFLGHTVPQVNVLVTGFPIRAMIAMLILGLTFTGLAQLAVDAIPTAIDGLRAALMGI